MFVSTFCIFFFLVMFIAFLASKHACDFINCEVGDDGNIGDDIKKIKTKELNGK